MAHVGIKRLAPGNGEEGAADHALAAAWIAQLSRDERIDASLLATRADLVAFLSQEPGSRLATGWRAQLVGRQLQRLVGGEAALNCTMD